MSIRIFHHRKKCIGCFACVAVAPDRWRMSKKDGKSVLLDGIEKKEIWTVVIHAEELERSRQAEKICPARVIRVSI